jgi:putative FmdB family regulatory protein
MPIYEFHCAGCRQDFELLVRSSRWEGTPCPHCGSKKLRKKLSVFAPSVSAGTASAPCDSGACPVPPRQRAGCGCCGPHHRH